MAYSMVKPAVDLKRNTWTSKLQNTKTKVLHRCLAKFSRVLNFRLKQERNVKIPRCSEAALAVVVQPTSSALPEDLVEEIRTKQESSIENPSCREATLAIEIPDDLVEEIIHRLPVKSLVRLKLVSKKWRSWIESGHLAEKHLRLRQKKYGVEELKITVEWSESGNIRTKYFSKRSAFGANDREPEDLRVAGSCNGLVCVYDLVYVYLSNPSTPVSLTRTLDPPRGTKLALTPPGITKLSVGFGRDVVTGRYKVVAFCSFDNDNRVVTKIFDLSTSKWRRRYKTAGPMPLSFNEISAERNPVLANGSLYWLLAHDHSKILVMDLHTEKFRTLLTPKDINVSSDFIYMWSLKDRLYVSDLSQNFDSDVWVLVQDEVSKLWKRTRFCTIDFVVPPLLLNSAWFSPSLVSPYQSSSSSR